MFGFLKNLFGTVKISFKEQMRKGEKYRLIFKCSGKLTPDRMKKVSDKIKEKLKKDLRITRIAFNEPEFKKLTVEGYALHDPLPLLLIGGLISGIAVLWGIRVALESVHKVMNVFTPNKVLVLCLLLGVPYLIFSGRLAVKGLRVKGLK